MQDRIPPLLLCSKETVQRGSFISHESGPAFGPLEDTSPFHVASWQDPPYTQLCSFSGCPPTTMKAQVSSSPLFPSVQIWIPLLGISNQGEVPSKS
jgi:hypothetical protein